MLRSLARLRRAMPSSELPSRIKVGIIGGTGLEDPEILKGAERKSVSTPFGAPSDVLTTGTIGEVDCVLLSRHGRKHHLNPSAVPYRANLWALKEEGCHVILATTACGSLKEEIEPGHLVVIDQFIDRTTKRQQSFYDGSAAAVAAGLSGVCHAPMHAPYDAKLRQLLCDVARHLNIVHHSHGTAVAIEGPRFSSRAESFLYRSWGADLVNMTTVPEVVLAGELGMPYASLALSTDYDCWREGSDSVSHSLVLETFRANASKAVSILEEAVLRLPDLPDLPDYVLEKRTNALAAVV